MIWLVQDCPNPFNARTTLGYDLPEAGRVSLRGYSIEGQLGKVLVDGVREQGHHAVRWDGTDQEGRSVSSGVYLVRMEAKNSKTSKKMVLLQ